MTDKQIIIDNVDVAECEFAVKPINDNEITCHCCKGLLQIATMHEQPESIRSGLCKNNPNCHYKNWKRKEQELERLQNHFYERGQTILSLEKDLKAKEQECETLASQLDFEVQKKECLEQECEKLKKKLKINEVFVDDVMESRHYCVNSNSQKERKILELQQQLDQLKSENDELKKIIERLDVPKHEVIDMDIALENEKLKAENEKLDTENKRLVAELANPVFDSFEELDKLKQTLTEIKEIAESEAKYFPDGDIFARPAIQLILQKISEVENG